MKVHKISFFLILIILISKTNQKELNTFSNYDIIFQTNINVHFIVDFDNKKVDGEVTISFKALEDGEVIILDTKSLIIKSIKDNTGNELDFKLDNYYRLESHGVPLKIYKEYSKDDTLVRTRANIRRKISLYVFPMSIDIMSRNVTYSRHTRC